MLAFKCIKDSDIQSFLNFKAITFQNHNWCTVYLILNKDEFDLHKIKIEAYFTLSHKCIGVCDDLSNTKKKEVGFSKTGSYIHFVLIGHL